MSFIQKRKSVADMSLEEYQEYINQQYNVQEEEEILQEEVEPLQEEGSAVKDLEKKLQEMTDHSWQAIDKEMRIIAKEYDMTPKELHKEFKSAHGGQIPDEWAKEQQVTEQCGWFPMYEATMMKRGNAYDVTIHWRGATRRLKFFWPDLKFPNKAKMQKAADLFYPGGRLITYYPTKEDSNDFMVVVPPMSENYVIVQEDDYVLLTEQTQNVIHQIEEEEGEVVSGVEMDDDGKLTFFISDNETGEERQVIVEGAAWTKKEGQNSEGGLNEKGRKSYEKANPGSDLKAPTKEKGNPRRKSFCARMKGMRKRQKKSNNTGKDRLSKSLRAWDC